MPNNNGVKIMNIGRSKSVPFPRVPSSIMAIVFPWLITILILYFDTVGSGEGAIVSTNPIVFFSIPLVFMFIFMPKDSWTSIKRALGIAIDSNKAVLIAVVSGLGGGSIGLMGNIFLTNAGIIPLYFSVLATSMPLVSIIIYHGVVSFFEESFSVLFIKMGANSLHKFGIGGFKGLTMAVLIGRGFWTSLHWFAYAGWAGPQSYPLFFIAFTLGVLFSFLSVLFGMFLNRSYFLIPAMTAHFKNVPA